MLTEHQLIAELAQIAEASEKVGQRTRNIYLGASWFNEEQQNILMQGYQALKANLALMSRLWTGFFGTERCRTPKIFQNPDFSLKRRHFSVFL
ncbi:hypothetical protein [Weissella confusa]|uniref:hypothetical protein n=1 Tax=Weissella confusa TaxID=1583 RepID=UPI001FD9D753|nr:hypothetical protein [Weissella confusa]